MKTGRNSGTDTGRRSFLKKASYVAPAILTMTAVPSFASTGSGYKDKTEYDHPWKKKDWGSYKERRAQIEARIKEIRAKIRAAIEAKRRVRS